MKKGIRPALIAVSTLLPLLLGLAMPLAALAQEGDTPTATLESSPTETASPEDSPTPEASSTEVPSETPTPETSPTSTETAGSETATETPSETPTPTETGTVTETLTPTTTPTLGEPIAPAVINEFSVIWCPSTVASPVENAMGCTLAYTSLDTLRLALAAAQPNKDGTIWIGTDYTSATNTTFDGAALTVMDDYKLTFKGAWTGTGGTIDMTEPSELGHRLFVTNWNNILSFSDITITGTSGASPLSITTTKNITLLRMAVSSNAFGPDLDNFDGGVGTGNISITNSTFNSNSGSGGLTAFSSGTITLSGVTVTGNTVRGAHLINTTASSALGVTVTNGTFNSNGPGDPGLRIYSLGNITLSNVTANGNAHTGAELFNTSGTGVLSITASQFSSNTGGTGGLLAGSHGAITLNAVAANGNTNGVGASLDNSGAPTAKTIALMGVNEFNSNRNNGLVIASKGLVSLKDVTASNNGISGSSGHGLYLINTYGANPGPGVTFTGTNIFNANYANGAYLESFGPINANNLVANSNLNQFGVWALNNGSLTAQAITFTGSSFFNYNDLGGLYAVSKGVITLNNLTANSSDNGSGAYIDNSTGSTFSSAVSILGTNTFLENDVHGLYVVSNGPISANNVTAEDNGAGNVVGFGVRLTNMEGTSTTHKISLTGTNSINRNYWTNLSVSGRGAIAISSVTANDSETAYGIDLDNTDVSNPTVPIPSTSNQPITITGSNIANGNNSDGVNILSYGAVTTTSVTADENGGLYGMSIANLDADTAKPVTLNGTNIFSENDYYGLGIASDGLIKANNVTASDNGAIGITDGLVINNAGASAGGVTFTGVNVFSNNPDGGAEITTSGAVAMSSVTASNNADDYGLQINNLAAGALTPKNVTISGTNVFNDNYYSGLYIFSYGEISLNSTTANGNGQISGFGDGVTLNNSTADTPKKVTISGVSSFSGNNNLGLLVMSDGLITANSISAGSNDDGGALLTNDDGGNTAGVTITGAGSYSLNDGPGLSIQTRGPITASNITSIGNVGDDGANFSNQNSATPQKITLTGTNAFSSNGSYGLFVYATGGVALKSANASNNTFAGVYVDSLSYGAPTSPQAFTLTGVSAMNDNGQSGLYVSSYGAISVASLTANGNNSYGAYLYNATSSSVQKVALTGVNTFNDNSLYGLYVVTKGAITSATSLSANGATGGAGIFLNNLGPGGVGGTGAVTLSGGTTANGNSNTGLAVSSHGAITVNNLTAMENGTGAVGYGATLENWDVTTPVDVKLTGTNKFTGNHQGGLYVGTDGAITGNNITASESTDGYGAQFDAFTAGKAFTLTGSNYFNSNYSHGLLVQVAGVVTVNNLNAGSNGLSLVGNGASINNTVATTPRNITLTGTNVFIGNDDSGLILNSDGTVAVSNLRAHDNNQLGVFIANDTGTAAVTLSGINAFRNNTNIGLYISSQGAVTVNKATADGNDQDGLTVLTPANITLMCGLFTNNTLDGVDVTTPAIFKRVGVFASGNGSLDIRFNGGGTAVVVRTCP